MSPRESRTIKIMPYSVQINTPKSYVMIYKDYNGIEHFYWTTSYQAFKDAIIDI